jgi:hypothetical protein
MADGRRSTDDPAVDRETGAAARVARLDGIDSGGAGRGSAPVAQLGGLPGSTANSAEVRDGPARGHPQAAEVSGPVDFGQLDAAGSHPARPVADLAAPAKAIATPTEGGQGEQPDLDGGGSGPVALFDSASLGEGREDVPVAELGPGALNRRAARGGRAGRRMGDGAERGRSVGAGGARAAARSRGSAPTSDRGGRPTRRQVVAAAGDGGGPTSASAPTRALRSRRRIGPFPIPPGAPAGRPVPVDLIGRPTSRAAVYAAGGGEARPSSIPTPIRSSSPGRSACGCSPTAPAPVRSWPRRCGARVCPTRRRSWCWSGSTRSA